MANDAIVSGQGSDQISAESGDDRIYQGPINSTEPDGSKDVLICGDGNDEIWINFSIDGDQVSDDCKIIHNGYQAFGYLIFYHIRLTFMI